MPKCVTRVRNLQELLKTILSDIQSTKKLIGRLDKEMLRTSNTSEIHNLASKILIAEGMLRDLQREAAEIEKYLRK